MDAPPASLPPDHEGSPVMVSVADKEQTPPSLVNKPVDRKSSNPKRKFTDYTVFALIFISYPMRIE